MAEKKQQGNVEIHKAQASQGSGLSVRDGVMVVITQAYCPNGHNLISQENADFDGHPGISLLVECADWSGNIVLSPIHGDHSRVGVAKTLTEGTNCTLRCPVCQTELPKLGKCRCENGGDLLGLYLRPSLHQGDMVAFCSVMGCHRSRIMDQFEVLSEFNASEDDSN